MTDRIDPKAIADELRAWTADGVAQHAMSALDSIRRAADTIDALVRETHARELHHFEVAQDRDALVAVVEKVRGVIGAEIGWESPAILIDRIQWALSTTPADALAEHDAALMDSLAEKWEALVQIEKPPIRGSLWLRSRAQKIRERKTK